MIKVSVNMSQEVYDYFKEYDFSEVAQALMDLYDYTNLPATSGQRYKEVRIDVVDENYISLYNVVGPRSKKVSLGRLFEFGYNMDALQQLDIRPLPQRSQLPYLLGEARRLLRKALIEEPAYEMTLGVMIEVLSDLLEVKNGTVL